MENNFKLAIIYGKDEETKKIKDGDIEYYGNVKDDIRHIEVLLDVMKEKYQEIPLFQKFTYQVQADIPAYFLTKLGSIVVFNSTEYKNDKIKHGKIGFIMLPDAMTEKQKTKLLSLADSLQDYSISLGYDLQLKDGLLDGKTLNQEHNETPKELLLKYFLQQDRAKTR